MIILSLCALFLHPFNLLGEDKREVWQPPEAIMDSVGVKPGMIIGEAGAGSGYFTFYLAQRVGGKGKVYANDISQRALNELQSRLKQENINNITTVLGETEDPLFPEKNLDMIIMVYVLHHLEKPVEFLKNLKKYMNAETQLVIIEKNTHKDREAYPHFMSGKQVLETVQTSDFMLERIETFLPKDTIYIYSLRE